MAVTASIVIDYGSVDNALISVELDSEENGSKTSFEPGDAVYLKIYSNTDYEVLMSSGTYAILSTNNSEELTEVLSFALSSTSSTSKNISSLGSTTWYGTDLGTLSALGGSSATSVQAGTPGTDPVGVCSLTYTAQYDSVKITPSGGMPSTYSILIVIRAI